MSQIVFQKDWFEVLKVKVTVRDIMVKIWLSNISSELLIPLQLNLVRWHIIIRWIAMCKDWIALLWSRSRSEERFKISVNVHLDNISSTAEPSITKLGMVIYIMSQSAMQEDWFAVLKFRVTVGAPLIKCNCSYHIYWITKSSTTKLGMVMHHRQPDCPPKRLVCSLQGQGHSEGSSNQNMTF